MACVEQVLGAAENRPQPLEVADLFRRHFDKYQQLNERPGPERLRVARDVMRCRTEALGGHLDVCSSCGFERPAYNSCRNRHCPKCQALRQARWVEARMQRILPTHYFHVVFTLPSELHELVRNNRRLLFDLLIKSAAASLEALAQDPRFFSASVRLGITCVLHTWTRELAFHPHVHCIVTGGGLSLDGKRWVSSPLDFLFPVLVLGALFRGKFLAGLAELQTRGVLIDNLTMRSARRRRERLYSESWIVYAKRPFGGPEQVYRYLGRYTHRVAISNARLVSLDDKRVVFRTRGTATATLEPIEFIRRFLQHVLPSRFVKIRHFGLLAPVHVRGLFGHARNLLGGASVLATIDDRKSNAPPNEPLAFSALLLLLTGIDLRRCPLCQTQSMLRSPLARGRAPPS